MRLRSKWLVIGSNSFSGAHCVEALLRSGSTVVGVSRSREAHPAFLPYRGNGSGIGRFQFHQLDLNQHMAALRQLLHEFQPEYVINFAAQGMVAQSWEHPHHWYQTNVVAMVRLHETLRELEGLKRYVHVSTPEVYGSCEGLVTEGQPFNPSTPYAVSQAACDMSLLAYHQAYAFPVVFTRAANVFDKASNCTGSSHAPSRLFAQAGNFPYTVAAIRNDPSFTSAMSFEVHWRLLCRGSLGGFIIWQPIR